MDDLYDNLENYKEEATIAELRNENVELKSKLEGCTTTLEKIQKDLDTLTSQYKQLELNYSSLLKTAKAEIERKTKIITDLNIEKDKIILQSYQNRSRSSAQRSQLQNVKDTSTYTTTYEKSNERPFGNSKEMSPHMKNNSNEADLIASKNITNSSNTGIKTRLMSIANICTSEVNPKCETKNQHKENTIPKTQENDDHKARALIRNRRKSMPAVRLEADTFCEDTRNTIRRPMEDSLRKNFDKRHTDHNSRSNSKASGSSSLEDKHNRYHEVDQYKGRHSRYDTKTDNDRRRDKSSHRRKERSPDRLRIGRKDYYDNPRHGEHDRHRVVETPPFDKYNSYRSRDPRKFHERSNTYDHRTLLHVEERYPYKHKIQHTRDDRDNKRMKIDPNQRKSEDNQIYSDEIDYYDKKYAAEQLDHRQFSTCQSPDHNSPEVHHMHQIKEIKLTATGKLDDPRISNKKYLLKKNDGKVVLSTAGGRNVDILPINMSAWGIKPVGIPDALIKKPSQEIEQTLYKIHSEIYNSISDTSMESGEILDEKETIKSVKTKNDTRRNTDYKVERNHGKREPNFNNSKYPDVSKTSHYKVRKVNKANDDKVSSQGTEATAKLTSSLKESRDNYQKLSDKKKEITQENEQIVPKPNKLPSREKSDNISIKISDFTEDFEKKVKEQQCKNIVAGDLELSDDDNEKSNYIINKNIDNSNVHKESVDSLKINLIKTAPPVKITDDINTGCHSLKTNSVKTTLDVKITNEGNTVCDKSNDKDSKETNHDKDTIDSCKVETTDNSEKSRSKRKSKLQESKQEHEVKVPVQISEKSSKKKEKPKDTKLNVKKTKFKELFDDSNSLILPEDLGLTTVPVHETKGINKCVPFLEDAQDAIDLDSIDTPQDPISTEISHSIDNKHTKPMDIETRTEPAVDPKPEVITKDVSPKAKTEVEENIYKNLEASALDKEKDVIKTVIISSGVQPQLDIENEQKELNAKINPQIKKAINQGMDIKALATSTPNKIWQPTVFENKVEETLPENSSIANNVDRADMLPVLNNSDNNTLESQTDNAVTPDVRIFVKRRRRVIKK